VEPGLGGDVEPAVAVVSALYPLGDLVLLSSVLFLVLSPGRSGRPTRLLVTGTVLTLALDLAFAVVPTFWPDLRVERLALAERMVAVVSEPIRFRSHLLRVGASVGLSSAHGCASGDEFIARADHAMLDAKRSGRGRAVVA
jgi:GGDEF domain-containing protein